MADDKGQLAINISLSHSAVIYIGFAVLVLVIVLLAVRLGRSSERNRIGPAPQPRTPAAPAPPQAPAAAMRSNGSGSSSGGAKKFLIWLVVIVLAVWFLLYVVAAIGRDTTIRPFLESLGANFWNPPQDSTVRDYGRRRPQAPVEAPPVSAEERARVEAIRDRVSAPPRPEWSEWIRVYDHFDMKAIPSPDAHLYRSQCSSSADRPGAGFEPQQAVSCVTRRRGRGQARWIRFQSTDRHGVDISYRYALS
ncbi:MAG TPA: hypothetical protein VF696_02120 [Candidatus Paceibacterota bacterium]|jgi:hypothetical protein